jgi:hypothetical protein
MVPWLRDLRKRWMIKPIEVNVAIEALFQNMHQETAPIFSSLRLSVYQMISNDSERVCEALVIVALRPESEIEGLPGDVNWLILIHRKPFIRAYNPDSFSRFAPYLR